MLLVISAVFIAFHYWQSQFNLVDSSVKSALNAVLRARMLSKVTGDYWENEMEKQNHILSKHPQADRVMYFRGVILNCELEAASAITFVEAVGNDAKVLREDLIALQNTTKYGLLSVRQKDYVRQWIDELAILEIQRNEQ